ncbi:hypothetical protein AWU65_06305 [Paenibacillus glucanolyticus]|uniref:Uncharacterized protein n=1 Tax=Paenibacillus glucanolyticus TaxID=59843 RepID=A0A163HMY3_9BACL|nr:hypothetical protein [Paenibacillus glucanolyticus]KZS45562.1 hypothetical protein AWU65_06305 [Paenibacillus glucanolyticus]
MKTCPPEINLNLSRKDKWISEIKGFLWNIRNWELRQVDSFIKTDGSSSIGHISKRRVVQRLFPCPVVLVELQDDVFVLGFMVGQGDYSFKIQFPDELILHQVQDAGDKWHQTFDQHNSIVWMSVSKLGILNIRYADSMLDRAVEFYEIEEVQRLLQIRDDALKNIGFHSIRLSRATGQPDNRIQAITRFYDGVPKVLTSEDLVQDMMSYSKLSNVCPANVNDVMQRARLLYVHGYSEWEFLTTAVHYAVLSLEASLRLLYDTWLGETPVRVEAKIIGVQVCETLEPSRDTILKWSNKNKALDVTVNGLILPRSKSNLTNHAVHIGVLTQWERDRIEYFLWLRDTLSHPTGTFIEWISWSRECIGEVCLLINLMWARFLVGMPDEFSMA